MTNENRLCPEPPKTNGERPPTATELLARGVDIFHPSGFVRKEPKATDLSPVKPKKAGEKKEE